MPYLIFCSTHLLKSPEQDWSISEHELDHVNNSWNYFTQRQEDRHSHCAVYQWPMGQGVWRRHTVRIVHVSSFWIWRVGLTGSLIQLRRRSFVPFQEVTERAISQLDGLSDSIARLGKGYWSSSVCRQTCFQNNLGQERYRRWTIQADEQIRRFTRTWCWWTRRTREHEQRQAHQVCKVIYFVCGSLSLLKFLLEISTLETL